MPNSFRSTLLIALALGFAPTSVYTSFALPSGVSESNMSAQDSLYKRLGGYDALAAVTDEFITRLATDPKEGRFFVGLSNDSKVRVRQHVVDFLCLATGGPCKYTGRDMVTAHTGLGITEEDWAISVKALGDTLDKFKVPPAEHQEVMNAVGQLKSQIVGR